jgi:hypothetical protein
VTFIQAGDPKRGLEYIDRAIAVEAVHPVPYFNRGAALRQLRRREAAVASYDKAIALKPDYAEAHLHRGDILRELKRPHAALASYERAIATGLANAEAHCSRGVVLEELGDLKAAMASYEQAIASRPDYALAYCNRANVLVKLNAWDAALDGYQRAIAIRPDYTDAFCGSGVVLKELRQMDAALSSYDQALVFSPDSAELHFNRANVLWELNRTDAALQSYDRALALKPDLSAALFNRSMVKLLAGDYESGWQDYECRWGVGSTAISLQRRAFRQPQWRGEDSLAGRTILLHSEQGLGDTLQFCRYARLVAERGATVILEVEEPLKELCSSMDGVALALAKGQTLPPFDFHCPLMSLPLAFHTRLDSIPAQVPYLHSSAEKRRSWQERLGARRRLRVGLVWSGGFRPNQPEVWSVNARRNIPLAKLAALRHPDIDFYSLQKGEPATSELANLQRRHWDGPDLIDVTDLLHTFSDTAALVEQFDLVISVDTSTAHLAGALGKPVWILNRFDTCWRWLLDRTDSPWYPTARLYRQQTAGDWDGVVQRVRSDLHDLASQGGSLRVSSPTAEC